MKYLKYVFLFIILGFGLKTLNSQIISYYEIYMSVAYLPSCHVQLEIYKKDNGNITHELHEQNVKCKKNIISLNDTGIIIEDLILKLDSLFKLDEFIFTVNKTFIDTLKSRVKDKEFYHISNEDIDNFFSRRDTLILKMSDIQKEKEYRSDDGIDYYIKIEYKKNNQDIIIEFEGDLDTFVLPSHIKNWIPLYLIYKEHKIFKNLEFVDEYFSDNNLENIIWRFISWGKEGNVPSGAF
ncbi:MAG: hypothetical protein PHC83_00950 [Bacteroidales bacterium]|nr:hypothetical protein [Bacteroidales bacterium]MDD4209333.1 hypothetical protein [Bacteroidales bacterium]